MSPPPTDATVDFPLILDAVGKPEYEHLLTEAAAYGTTQARLDLDDEELRAHAKETKVNLAMNRLVSGNLFKTTGGQSCRRIGGFPN